MSLDRMPELGSSPVSLSVKLPAIKSKSSDHLGDGLRELYRRGEFLDVTLVCAEQTYHAHRAVLAAKSEVFKQGLAASIADTSGTRQEVRFADISNPEAVKLMLDHIYMMELVTSQEYNPRTQEINKDVLRLAQNFRMPCLAERAAHWLAKDLTSGNAVERLMICEEFSLDVLKDKILEQLTCNKRALAEVARSPEIMNYPKLMQALLQQTAGIPEEDTTPQPKKKGRKS
jgi:hypothetical protein